MIERKLKHLVYTLRDILSDDDFYNALELIEYEEYGVALDLICTQLYENDIPITHDIKKVIMELIRSMELDINMIDGIIEI